MFDDKNTSKLFRFEGLLQAIDFFTQKFNLEQISFYAFEFANEILTLNSSALFLKEGDSFKLKKKRNYDKLGGYAIPNTEALQRVATFHGDVMKSNFDSFFNPEDMEAFDTKLIIPLIIQDLLYGFILTNGKALNDFNEDDIIMSRTLMRLFNNSLENSKNFSDLKETNKQLDQKIFNLFSINQSSRILLSELNLDRLYTLSVDIFSEITSSQITSFGLYDEIRDKIIIRGYRDVFSPNKYYGEFELVNESYSGYKAVFHYERDKEELKEIFKNYEEFTNLGAEYIILLVKDKILGFVTLSKAVNDRSYDEALFELIESLASSTYISLTNALFFKEVNRQKLIIEQKLNVLTKLNSLIRNLNSCLDIDELCDLTIKTLGIGFGIKKAFIALRTSDHYEIKNWLGFIPQSTTLDLTEDFKGIGSSEMFYKFSSAANLTHLTEGFVSSVGESNCLVISPIKIEGDDVYEDSLPMGYIVVLQTPQSLKEEELLLIDTISNSIAPTINHMNLIESLKAEYTINTHKLFVDRLRVMLHNRSRYFIDFHVYYKKLPKQAFTEPNLTSWKGYEHYYFDNMLFIISEAELEASQDIYDGCIEAESIEDFIEKAKNL